MTFVGFNFRVALCFYCLTGWGGPGAEAGPIDFNREVRPILAETCFKCHGPDRNRVKSGLRLDLREGALKPAKSGKAAIVPGNPEASELVRRVFSSAIDNVMPPADSHASLSAAQRELLKRWVSDGADYARHWAFVPPRKAPPPVVREVNWPRNPIDHFILAKLEDQRLPPTPAADRATLIRRVTLDLLSSSAVAIPWWLGLW